MHKKNHHEEFLKWAHNYDASVHIQKVVAKRLVEKIKKKPKTILDLGCGTGEILKNINWKYDQFVGIDNSLSMCKLHPQGKNTEILCLDFESKELKQQLSHYVPFDLIISSSSLQWADNLDLVFDFAKKNAHNIAFAIFTDQTFKTIYDLTRRPTFLPNALKLVSKMREIWNIDYEIKVYRLDFKDNISKLKHIKQSGVAGGVEQLSYSQTKSLIQNYPYAYLEFEVLYIHSSKI